MTGEQAPWTSGSHMSPGPNPTAHAVTTAGAAAPGAAGSGGSGAAIRDADGAQPPPIPVVEDKPTGSGERVDAAISDQLWDVLARAQAEYDPGVLDVAESAVVTLYLPVAHGLARSCSPGASCCMDAAEQALIKAVRHWPRQGGSWGFEEYARGAIETEIRGVHEGHIVVGVPTPRSGLGEHISPAASSASPRARP